MFRLSSCYWLLHGRNEPLAATPGLYPVFLTLKVASLLSLTPEVTPVSLMVDLVIPCCRLSRYRPVNRDFDG